MTDSLDDADYSDELLAAISFVDDFQFPAMVALPEIALDADTDEYADSDGLTTAMALAQQQQQQQGQNIVVSSAPPRTLQHKHNPASIVSLDELGSQDNGELSRLVADPSSSMSVDHQNESLGSQTQTPALQATKKAAAKRRAIVKTDAKQKKTWDPNKARNERREELVYLRKMVADLESQLARASAQTAYKTRVWEEIAKNQWGMRETAERENIRLKLVLESQLKIARSLEKHLGRATSTNEIQRCFAANQIRHMHPPTRSDGDAAIFDELLVGVEQSYAEIDAIYAATGLATSETSHINAQMRSAGDDTTSPLFLEIFATKVLPFGFAATVETVWNHFVFAKERLPSRFYYNKTPKVFLRASCAYIKNFHLELHAKGRHANFGVKQVIRRYDERERVVIVWRALIDPIEFCDEPLAGVRFLEKGYVVIKKPAVALASDGVGSEFTLLQPCYVISPLFSEQYGEGNHPQVGAMTDFVLATTAMNIRSSHQMIEDALLQHAMAGLRSAATGSGGAGSGAGSGAVSV